MIDERLGKSVFSLTSLNEADADDIDFWLTRTPDERIEALERLRRWAYRDEAVNTPMRKDVFSFRRLGDE